VGNALPVLDVTALFGDDTDAHLALGQAIDAACRTYGFFALTGHGVDSELRTRLDAAARRFFALPEAVKEHTAMRHGGRAWRGWFPLGGELTSGRPDMKEGIYYGSELPPSSEPLRGPNLFPAEVPELRDAVLEWIDTLTELGHRILGAMALGLGLDAGWFREHLTADPIILFRIFRYPPLAQPPEAAHYSVQEHTDYGLLTLLVQDDRGGLEVRSGDGWIAVPPDPDVIVCNIGDMLDRMTGGRYRSTAHRVRNLSAHDRLSFPLFLDPSWDAEIAPIPLDGPEPDDDAATRWDRSSLRELSGTYGEYLLAKVSKVFPELGTAVLQ
jgi:isopenicillin N synthase-like dioxygenase